MAKTLTRAERYKRNYRLIKNRYHDAKLAKRAQTWSDDRIYNELGIKIVDKLPDLKPSTKFLRTKGARELKKFQYGLGLGLEVEEALKLVRYKDERIKNTYDYLEAKSKKFTTKNKVTRMDLWANWSLLNMPPEIETFAREINRNTKVGPTGYEKPLDDDAHYGYVLAFYMFVENKSLQEIQDLVKPDPHDMYRVLYTTEVRA